jgi:uncharacterized protein
MIQPEKEVFMLAVKETPIPHQSQPVAPTERLTTVDMLRGFAVFGVLVVNMFYFFNPWYAPQITPEMTRLDQAAHFLINFLFVSKFYTIFSFLFGLGMFLQMSRAEAREVRFVPLYLRRLVILALFGFAHGVLLWTGDILLMYAVTGVLLLFFFRKRSPRTLLVWTILLIAIPVLLIGVSIGVIELARFAPPESGAMAEIERQFALARTEFETATARDFQIYANGSFSEITAERFDDFVGLLVSIGWFLLPSVLAMFLLGVRAGKLGWFTRLDGQKGQWQRYLAWTLPMGLLLNFYVAYTGFEQNQLGIDLLTWETFAQIAALNIGSVLLSQGYVALLTLYGMTAGGQRLMALLAPVGRMALTNYLTHSLVMTTLANGYGFGLFGQVGMATTLLMAVILFAIQIPLSHWWLQRFRFGPFEWLWRTLTHGQWQPMKEKSG